TAAERAERAFRTLEEEERSLADQEGMSAEGAVAVVRGDLRSLEAADRRDAREEESLALRLASLRGQLDDETAE
ncbi:MAG: hypothetical protein GWN07_35710, partial [Actinobacteria bacterium]|nr:hypothetical protein [Actinomycetota bacterium]NIU70769.1 hypothetical protein [Actinomycetota bacterium]NIW32682.1 hypothetical protein [Actinomycetota bacterium]NIX24865.1 hypothetical protein [Actinomycetota bacterium]